MKSGIGTRSRLDALVASRPGNRNDTELDLVAVSGSRERLDSIYGRAWRRPPEALTAEQDREDLQHHADEMETHESFDYAQFDAEEAALLGCVYIDPPEKVRTTISGRRRPDARATSDWSG